MEETLNESIRESMGARIGRVLGKKKGATEDDEDAYMRYFTNIKYIYTHI